MVCRNMACAVLIGLVAALVWGGAARADHAWWKQPPAGSILDERPRGDRWVGRVKWDEGYLEVLARGAVDPRVARNQAHAEVLALKTARYRAYEKLLEIVRGVRLDAYTQLENELLADGSLMARVRGMVRGARIISQEVSARPDGSVVAEVRLGLLISGPAGLSATMLQALRRQPRARPPVFKPSPRPRAQPRKPYTGLIVVATGLGARPAMFPRILEAKSRKVVYGPESVDKFQAMQRGVVGYAVSVERARQNQRVGANPLVVKALKAQGNNQADLVVSYQDAVKIFAADIKSGFLAQCRVIIVIN